MPLLCDPLLRNGHADACLPARARGRRSREAGPAALSLARRGGRGARALLAPPRGPDTRRLQPVHPRRHLALARAVRGRGCRGLAGGRPPNGLEAIEDGEGVGREGAELRHGAEHRRAMLLYKRLRRAFDVQQRRLRHETCAFNETPPLLLPLPVALPYSLNGRGKQKTRQRRGAGRQRSKAKKRHTSLPGRSSASCTSSGSEHTAPGGTPAAAASISRFPLRNLRSPSSSELSARCLSAPPAPSPAPRTPPPESYASAASASTPPAPPAPERAREPPEGARCPAASRSMAGGSTWTSRARALVRTGPRHGGGGRDAGSALRSKPFLGRIKKVSYSLRHS